MKQSLTEDTIHSIEDMPVNYGAIIQEQNDILSAYLYRLSANYYQPSVFLTSRGKEGGFTLIELLVTVLVAAIILVFAVPSFQGVMNNNRVVSAANDLTTTLARARMAAIKANTTAKVRSNVKVLSNGKIDWSKGYQVEADLNGDSINEIVSVVEAVNDPGIDKKVKVTFVGSTSTITFNSLGGLGATLYPSSATFTESFTLNAPKAYGRTLTILGSGSTSVVVNDNTN